MQPLLFLEKVAQVRQQEEEEARTLSQLLLLAALPLCTCRLKWLDGHLPLLIQLRKLLILKHLPFILSYIGPDLWSISENRGDSGHSCAADSIAIAADSVTAAD